MKVERLKGIEDTEVEEEKEVVGHTSWPKSISYCDMARRILA